MMVLYQFGISHYCEKARWALDYKGLAYKSKYLLPGPHLFQTRSLSDNPMVPILVNQDQIVQNSSDIITYLDQIAPDKPLSPEDPALCSEALELERLIDETLGVHVRRYCYYWLLQEPSMVITLWSQHGPWYGKAMYKLVFPMLSKKLRRSLKINPTSAERSREKIVAGVASLNVRLKDAPFLVGEKFSRADMAAAALLAPLFRPEGYGLVWPETLPGELEAFSATIAAEAPWVNSLYADYRMGDNTC